jgi:hypothetical protein
MPLDTKWTPPESRNAGFESRRSLINPVSAAREFRIMSLVGNCKFNYFATRMTTREAARTLETNDVVTLV